MDRDEVLKLAKEAGFMFHDAGFAPILHTTPNEYSERCFERFAAAIRAATKEEDAGICEEISKSAADTAYQGGTAFTGSASTWMAMSAEVSKCVSAIRASK